MVLRIHTVVAATTLALLLLVLLAAGVIWRRPRQRVVAVVPETTAQEIWESEHAGSARAADEFGWKIYWNGPSREDDFPRQIQIVNLAIGNSVDGLILSPDHDVALISSVRAALAHRIPTVIVGSPLGVSPEKNLTFVVNDDAAAGRMAAQRASLLLKTGDTVAILGVNPNILASIARADAFESALRNRMDGMVIEERRSTSFSFAEAEETAEETIHASPRLRVIFTLNVNETRAVYGALVATGFQGKIALIACDQDLDLMHHVRSGSIDSLIAQDTYAMGYEAVQLIHKQLMGEETNREIVVQPVLITRQNIDSDKVQKVLNMNWRVRP